MYLSKKTHFRHCLLNLRRVKQANVSNRYSCASSNVHVKDPKASFYKNEIRSVNQVEYNLQA